MTLLTVALLQLAPPGADLAANLATGLDACRRAAATGADIALFPEMWSNGYTSAFRDGGPDNDLYRHPRLWAASGAAAGSPPENAPGGPATGPGGPVPVRPRRPADIRPEAVWAGEPLDDDAEFLAAFRDLAAELRMAIAVSYLQRWPGAPRNAVRVFDRYGRTALTQAKVHTCAFDLPEAALTPADAFEVATVDTAAGEVRLGAMICYDREFPESARALMLGGAELILVPNACTMDANRVAQLRTRAMENMVAVAMANYAGPGWGHSAGYDGMTWGDRGSRDMLVVSAGEHPGIYPATFDMAALREYRHREAWGDAFRRPVAYGCLTGGTVADPFIRVDRDGHPLPR